MLEQQHRHALLEHQEDIAFSFIHDELTRNVLEYYGIEPHFFARHFGTLIVEEIVEALEEDTAHHSCYALDVMQAFFQRYDKEFKVHDISLLRKGIKKTFVRFSNCLSADESLKVEMLLDDTQEEVNRDFHLSLDESAQMHELLEDMDHFVTQLSVDAFWVSGFAHSVERIVILFENYSHLLKSKEPFIDLGDFLFGFSITLRGLMDVERNEAFVEIQEHLVCLVASLMRFQEAIEYENLLHVKDFGMHVVREIEAIQTLLKQKFSKESMNVSTGI